MSKSCGGGSSSLESGCDKKDYEDGLVNRISDLKQLSENIEKRLPLGLMPLQLESAIRKYNSVQTVLNNAVDIIYGKFDIINTHIDNVLK